MCHGHNRMVTLVFSKSFIFILIWMLGYMLLPESQVVGAHSYQHEIQEWDISSDGRPQHLKEEEKVRREIVKVQILQRLGLSEKPRVNKSHKISKDLVLETLQRTETWASAPAVPDGSSLSTSGEDDASNYAKTSQIISFPDKGPVLNGHSLLSFSHPGSHSYGAGVRVKKAHLWVKLERAFHPSISEHFAHMFHPNRRVFNLYVFRAIGNFSKKSISKLQNLQLNRKDVQLEMVSSRSVSDDSLGWQKLDVSEVVQKWFGRLNRHRTRHHRIRKNKLILMVDCSGCGQSIQAISFAAGEDEPGPSKTVMSQSSSQSALNPESYSHNVAIGSSDRNDDDVTQYSSDRQNNFLNSDGNTAWSSHPLDNNGSGRNVENMTEIPFLVLETETLPNFRRARRRALECSDRVKQCCKQRFYISFRELGWDDWIIAPRGYYANYCRGHCGGIHRTPDTFLNYHTHVIEEYRKTFASSRNISDITPCCAPTKFAPMSLIYFGPDLNIIKRDLPKMIVEECGCP